MLKELVGCVIVYVWLDVISLFVMLLVFVQARPGEDVADVRIVGDKFQAGWVPSPTAQMSGATCRLKENEWTYNK